MAGRCSGRHKLVASRGAAMKSATSLLPVLLVASFMSDGILSSEEQIPLVTSLNKFAADLYEAMQKTTTGNIIMSPFNLNLVLAMAYEGANGVTANEMERVLHLSKYNKTLLEGYKSLSYKLNDNILKSVARIYIDTLFKLSPNYEHRLTNNYMSSVEIENFTEYPEAARENINTWVENVTNHKIKNLLPQGSITYLTQFVLVSAIHFKGIWKKQFDKRRTHDMAFHVTAQNQVMVKMMNQNRIKLPYQNNKKFGSQIVELLYEGGKYSMLLIVPNLIDGLNEVENKLKDSNLSKLLSGLHETMIDGLYLPKFKIEKTWPLNNILKEMGMSTAFIPEKADFSCISNSSIYISYVIQKAFIEVNEEGTEAAAATGLVVSTTSVRNDLILVKADRPFFGYIIQKPHNVILFTFKVANPSKG